MHNIVERLSHKLRNDIRSLHHAREREAAKLFIAEGVHLNIELLKSGLQPYCIVCTSDAPANVEEICGKWLERDVNVFRCTSTDMDMMTDTTAPQSIIAVVPFIEEKPTGDSIIILDAVSDPGNVGTIIRTATWFGFSDVVLCDQCADLYNPKTMRSSAGTAFHMNVLRKGNIQEYLGTLNKMSVIGTIPSNGKDPSILREQKQFALIIGSEARGLSSETLGLCTDIVSIPGGNGVESLNAATAAAILCYEARAHT